MVIFYFYEFSSPTKKREKKGLGEKACESTQSGAFHMPRWKMTVNTLYSV